jgi:hypothetical protein
MSETPDIKKRLQSEISDATINPIVAAGGAEIVDISSPKKESSAWEEIKQEIREPLIALASHVILSIALILVALLMELIFTYAPVLEKIKEVAHLLDQILILFSFILFWIGSIMKLGVAAIKSWLAIGKK